MATHDQVSLSEASEILSVSYATLRSWRKRGLIHPAGIVQDRRRTYVFELSELRALAAKHRPRPTRKVATDAVTQ